MLDPRGPIGAANRTLLIDSVAIMLAIVIPVIVATLAFAWWFRASNHKATYLPDWEFSARLELVVWSIPAMTIILLGGVTWIGAHQLDPSQPLDARTQPLDVQVVSLDWKWLFIYPEQGVASVNQLVIPVGTPVRFSLTSASVLNTFFVPQLGSMIYTMNGMRSTLHLQADAPGRYAGMSAHFSGDGFSDMRFTVQAVDARAFETWVASTRGAGRTLDGSTYLALARQGSPAPVTTYASVDLKLFDRIVAQDLPPGPGPAVERQGAAETPAATKTSRKP